jgi:chromosomal replication initiator protein
MRARLRRVSGGLQERFYDRQPMPEDALHDDLDSIWGRVTEDLRASLPASTFDLWLRPLRPLSAEGSTLRVTAPRTIRAWVERRYSASLEASLRAQDTGLEHVVVVEEGAESGGTGSTGGMEAVESLDLDPRHTFERFVIGSGNRLAHAAALAVAELPGEAYNPLFLHGPPGLGKTHLLGAIADYLRRRRPELTVHYTTADRFTTEFVTALRKNPDLFKRRYRKLDALLIDDVQALEGKEHTQEEFVHTFNALHVAGKQIVLSSDRPPEAITRLAERLRDRFEWGLRVGIGPPDLRTRTALLWRMTSEVPVEITDPAVLRDIAGIAAGNVRRLEGAMTRIAALSSVLGEPVNRALIRKALDDPVVGRSSPDTDDSTPGAPSVPAIQGAVCSTLGISQSAMLSPSRAAEVAHGRQIAMYLARELTPLSLADIARHFDRDHTTILHAVRAVSARAANDADVSDTIHRARELLGVQHRDPLSLTQRPPARPPIPSTDEVPQVKP